MDETKMLMKEGGLNTGKAEVDPKSGNEVPPGSMPEEVRDDIDAKLSGGEYVIPADVLRFYGVHFFEKLRKKAKEGLSEMDEEGRIGGEMDSEGEEDDFPFGEDELEYEDDGEEDDPKFATGGLTDQAKQSVSQPTQTFTPEGWGGDTPTSFSPMEVRTYENGSGAKIQIMFLNGNPVTKIPAGYYPEGQVPSSSATGEVVQQTVREREGGDRSADTGNQDNKGWADGLDFNDTNGVMGWANDRIKDAKTVGNVSKAAGVLGGVGAVAGGVIGAVSSLSSLSDIRAAQQVAEAKGNKELSDKLKELEDQATKDMGVAGKALADMVASGTRKASGYLNEAATGGATSTSPTGTSMSSSTGDRSVSRGDSGGGRATSTASGVSGDVRSAETSQGTSPSGYGLGSSTGTSSSAGSFAGSSSSGSTSSPGGYSMGSEQTDKEKNETSGGYSMGLQKGGLVQRRKSKKC